MSDEVIDLICAGETFHLSLTAGRISGLIHRVYKLEPFIPLVFDHIDPKMMDLVVEYMHQYVSNTGYLYMDSEGNVWKCNKWRSWLRRYLERSSSCLVELLRVANYLDISPLYEDTSEELVNRIKSSGSVLDVLKLEHRDTKILEEVKK